MKIFSIEGNIGSGKSTLLNYLNDSKIKFVYLQEPVNEWNEVQDSAGVTILEKYYQNQSRYSFSFQMMAYITRLSSIRKAIRESGPDTIIITERSLYTDREIFAKMLYDAGHIEQIEYTIYLKWFNEFLHDINLAGIIYVKTLPTTCTKRIKERNRKGESSISLKYLEECHNYHEIWLKDTKIPLLCLDGEREQSLDWVQQIETFVKSN